jgi:RNA recognition motif-containing protein
MNIYVGNLSYDTADDDLREAFEKFGTVSSASVIQDRDSGRSRGFGFVEMPDPTEAQAAINALNGSDLQGRNLRVNEARPREERPQRDAGPGGGGRRSW